MIVRAVLGIFFGSFALLQASDFSWKDTEGKFLDLRFKDRPVIRYQYEAIDESSSERRHDTYKPFHHVYSPDGEGFITKGPGGKFTHHRGIYFGFSKCSYTDKDGKKHGPIDTWHCKKAHQIHRSLLSKSVEDGKAAMTSEIGWISNDGVQFATEERTLTFTYQKEDLVVSFSSTVTPVFGGMTVDGDPQHAGFHFRASNDVAAGTAKQTYYIRPKTGKGKLGGTINWGAKSDTEATRDLPWKVMSYVIGDDRYSILYIDSPENPKPARFSERDYGRFGSYFKKTITPDAPLKVNYHLIIRKGEFSPEAIPDLVEPF